jgi:hypothetical protein
METALLTKGHRGLIRAFSLVSLLFMDNANLVFFKLFESANGVLYLFEGPRRISAERLEVRKTETVSVPSIRVTHLQGDTVSKL